MLVVAALDTAVLLEAGSSGAAVVVPGEAGGEGQGHSPGRAGMAGAEEAEGGGRPPRGSRRW